MLTLLTSLFSILATPLSAAGTLIGNYFEHKMELSRLAKEAEIARAKAEVEAAADIDSKQVEENKTSWKDEYIVAIVTIPIVASFIPYLQPFVKAGFYVLYHEVPDWYIGLFITVCVSVMGARAYTGFKSYFDVKRK